MCSQKIAEKNDDYKKSYEQIVECMEPGSHENLVDGFEIAELVTYNTLKSEDEQIKLKEYIDCKKVGQNDNYDITGETLIPECLNFTKDIKNHRILTNSDGKSNVLGNKKKSTGQTEARLNENV